MKNLVHFIRFIPVMGLAFVAMVASAQEQSAEDAVRENLQKIIPEELEITSITQTPMEGVYHVQLGNQDLYAYSRGEFLMLGDVYDVDRQISWSDERKEKARQQALMEFNQWSENEMIIMGDPDGTRYITVFTDTDCGWCQKFHRDIPALKEGGLKVRYLMWPRAGIGSDSYDEAIAVWCAESPPDAMTTAKAGEEIERKFCEHPVKEHLQMGSRLGVQGTPFILLDNGEVLGGYVPPEQILAEAGLISAEG